MNVEARTNYQSSHSGKPLQGYWSYIQTQGNEPLYTRARSRVVNYVCTDVGVQKAFLKWGYDHKKSILMLIMFSLYISTSKIWIEGHVT